MIFELEAASDTMSRDHENSFVFLADEKFKTFFFISEKN